MSSTRDLQHVVVVGASLAGLRAAETLRAAGFEGSVTVVGAEPHHPYDRPPLSKKLLAGEWEPDRIRLRRADGDDLDVTWRLGVPASGLDVDGRAVQLGDGEVLPFDGVIIATGATPRRLPGQERFAHVHELRTLDDALRLRSELTSGGRRVVVVGAGFIGLEVAATSRRLGNDVVVLEGAHAPLVRALGETMGRVVADLHEREGVEIRCDVTVERLDDGGIVLDTDELEADVVIVGIGVAPATQWLADSGIELRDGVVCDETLAVRRLDGSTAPWVAAAGDVARWWHPLFEEELRVEHWTNAAEQGALAAKNLLATAHGLPAEPSAEVPFFWSDQYTHRLQFLGRAHPDDDVEVVAGPGQDGRLLALYGRNGRLRGALGLDAPRWVMPMRRLLLGRARWQEALEVAGQLSRDT